jgi:hypothetical protein
MIASVAVAAVGFTAAAAAWGSGVVDRCKAPRELARALPPDQTRRDVRLGAYGWFQPSLVFYCQREVRCLQNEYKMLGMLQDPLPAYVFLPAAAWDDFQQKFRSPYRVVAHHRDLYTGCEVLVVTNE